MMDYFIEFPSGARLSYDDLRDDVYAGPMGKRFRTLEDARAFAWRHLADEQPRRIVKGAGFSDRKVVDEHRWPTPRANPVAF